MLFSVLMANYNNSRFLGAAIQSVLEQTYGDWEIVLVDDGSTDNFEEVAASVAHEKRIRVYRNGDNRGCAFTKHRCISLAAGELFAFLDTDDRLHPDALATMVEAHRRMPRHSIIHSTHYICNGNMETVKVATYPKALPPNTPFLLLGDGSIHHFATFKKTLYELTDGISNQRTEDLTTDQDLYYVLEEVGDVHFVNEPLYYYRIHAGSISNWGNEAAANEAHYALIEATCQRRIRKLKSVENPEARSLTRRYRTRYHKVRMLRAFRQRRWQRFAGSALLFPFVGGMGNVVSYLKKLPRGGLSIIRKSLFGNYKVLEGSEGGG